MAKPAELYRALGGAAGCRALATAFYTHVEQDPILRPLFPSTFRCAIEEFSAFLVQFLGGEGEATQRRWWLSLRESHQRFDIGPRERTAWLRAMSATLEDESIVADAGVRQELAEFFQHSSAHVVNKTRVPAPGRPLAGELAPLWEEQLALDEAVAAIRSGDAHRCIELVQNPVMQARFARSPSVHACFLALAAKSKLPGLRAYSVEQIRTHPSLVHERYRFGRTLLHDASASGDIRLVEELLEMGAGQNDDDTARSLYCVGNECRAPGGSQVVRALLRKNPSCVNAAHGVKRCTALHMAARRGNVEVIGTLLDMGADIEARDSAGDTPLRRAVNCNKVDVAKLLLARGADPHSTGSRGLTPARAARSSPMESLFSGHQARP